MTAGRRVELALNVYSWGRPSQDRILVEAIGPLVEDFRARGWLDFFFFDRYDARGPHLFVALGLPEKRREELVGELSARLDDFLKAHPSDEQGSADELAARHRACRGRIQNAIDELPGLAAADSHRIAEHSPAAYPFTIGAGLADPESLRQALDAQACWALRQLAAAGGRVPQGAALRFLASVDAALRRRRQDVEGFWRYYAGTLLLDLPGRLEREEPRQLADSLAAAVSAANREAFTRVFAAVARPDGEDPRAARWVDLLIGGEDPQPGVRGLRSLAHTALKELGMMVRQEMPIVFFAWQRSFGWPFGP